MEYPMGTLLAGPGLGTVFHEWMHSWYQMMLGTNESLYAWMDEGFTEFATNLVESYYRDNVTRPKVTDPKALRALDSTAALLPLHHAGNYAGYYSLAKSGFEEPLSTHADHFNTNFAYSQASYSKGCVMLEQLGYIIGGETRDSLLMHYYRLYRYKHPTAQDFIRLAEKQSGQQLDWYLEYWMNSTKTIDYKIDSLWEEGGVSKIRLRRVGLMPMPIDLQLTFKDGTSELHTVPLNLQYGYKRAEHKGQPREIHQSWLWTHPTYTLSFKRRLTELKKAEIDPTKRLADMNPRDNVLELNW
jgi:aminopeptidase N